MNDTRLITAPTDEPVDLEFMKLRLRVDGGDEDDFIASLLKSGREHIERLTGRALMPQTWQLVLDAFPAYAVYLPWPPLVSLTVTYVDPAGNSVVVAASTYVVDAVREPARVVPVTSWPTATLAAANGVIFEFIAGYADADTVPEVYKQAIQVYVADSYENRETAPTDAAERAIESLLRRELRGVR